MSDGTTQEIALADGARLDVTLHQPAPVAAADALDRWVAAHVRNSAYSRDTSCWNAVQAAVAGIKAALAATDARGGK